MNALYILIGILFVLLPIVVILKTPYAGRHEIIAVVMRLLIGIPIFMFLLDIFMSVFDQVVNNDLIIIWISLGTLAIFSLTATISIYSPPQARFYPHGTVKLYGTYSSQSASTTRYSNIELGGPEFIVELHQGDKKWIQKFDSEDELLNSVNSKSSSTCWYCRSEDVQTYLRGTEKDQYSDSFIYNTGPPIRSTRVTEKGLCESCTLMVLDDINKESDKTLRKEDLVAAQI